MTIKINTDSNLPNASGGDKSKRRRKRAAIAIGITVLLHLAVIAAAMVYFPDWRTGLSGESAEQIADRTLSSSAGAHSESAESENDKAADPKPKDFNESVEQEVLESVGKAEAREDSENRTVLEQKAAELTDISSPESIEKMAPILTNALNLKPRATAPAKVPPKGPFEAERAQIYKVRREATDSGKFRYVSVLIDAEGRTLEIELDEAEGESVYKTMKLVEENPLLEKVYRELVIPAMDKATSDK